MFELKSEFIKDYWYLGKSTSCENKFNFNMDNVPIIISESELEYLNYNSNEISKEEIIETPKEEINEYSDDKYYYLNLSTTKNYHCNNSNKPKITNYKKFNKKNTQKRNKTLNNTSTRNRKVLLDFQKNPF